MPHYGDYTQQVPGRYVPPAPGGIYVNDSADRWAAYGSHFADDLALRIDDPNPPPPGGLGAVHPRNRGLIQYADPYAPRYGPYSPSMQAERAALVPRPAWPPQAQPRWHPAPAILPCDDAHHAWPSLFTGSWASPQNIQNIILVFILLVIVACLLSSGKKQQPVMLLMGNGNGMPMARAMHPALNQVSLGQNQQPVVV